VAHQADCEVTVAPRAAEVRPLGRLDHPPFVAPRPDEAALAAAGVEALGDRLPPPVSPAPVRQAAVLSILARAPLLVSGQDCFRDLIPLSSWSMNVASPPGDTPLVRQLARAAQVLRAAPRAGVESLEAILAGDERRMQALVRDRRRGARAAGPEMFAGIAPRSAGLRAFCVMLDLLPGFAVAPAARDWLRGLQRERALDLLAPGMAVFL
jgi:hypothetical protein